MNELKCPYKESGLCYRKGCIYIPQMDCMKKREYDDIMLSARKYIKKKKTRVRTRVRG